MLGAPQCAPTWQLPRESAKAANTPVDEHEASTVADIVECEPSLGIVGASGCVGLAREHVAATRIGVLRCHTNNMVTKSVATFGRAAVMARWHVACNEANPDTACIEKEYQNFFTSRTSDRESKNAQSLRRGADGVEKWTRYVDNAVGCCGHAAHSMQGVRQVSEGPYTSE